MAKLALVYSRDAAADYDDILAFSVGRFGGDVADAYMSGIEAACERLREFPEMAPVHPVIRPEIRCLRHRSHRVFYRVERDRVLVVRILHHARATPVAL